ncbi:hypothetical protein ACFQV2_00600 [Actinokineospora soli]|uniref:Uncharacterized protein n=1 Tax=Actinokineospora soli TaxID=1048753 RepID=A0ABW2TFB3_9PSEU
METGGDPIYIVTADRADRERMRVAAFEVLAADWFDMAAWWQSAFLTYQAPTYKKGSDAGHRVFLVATGCGGSTSSPTCRTTSTCGAWCSGRPPPPSPRSCAGVPREPPPRQPQRRLHRRCLPLQRHPPHLRRPLVRRRRAGER